MENNMFQKVAQLVNNGLNVAEVDDRLFIFTSFEASQQSSSQSIDYCRIRGAVEITEFMNMDTHIRNPTAFFQKIQQIIADTPLISIDFNKFTGKYYLYRRS